MSDSWFHRFFESRWRVLTLFGAISVTAMTVFFWVDLCVWRAEVNLQQRNHAAAAIWVNRSLWFRSEADATTCLLQIRIARRQGEFRDVESKLHEAVKRGVPRARIQRERWLAMAQTNQFGAMQEHWNELLRDARDDEPEIARAHYTWAILNHHLEIARKTLELWHQDYPLDPEPLVLTGRYYQSQSDRESTEKAYREAFALAPESDEIRLAFANALQMRLKTNEAIPLFQQHLRKHPNQLDAIQGLGQCLATKGEVREAILLLQDALKTHPDDFTLQKNCGEMQLSIGDAVAAAVVLEKAWKTIPEHANIANSLARAWKACGRTADAEPLFAFVTESIPKLAEMSDLETELRSQPNNLELRMKIASIVAKYISKKDAILWYENLLKIAPNYLPAHRELVILYPSVNDEKKVAFHSAFLRQNSP